jgi:hypothetical protein
MFLKNVTYRHHAKLFAIPSLAPLAGSSQQKLDLDVTSSRFILAYGPAF